MPSTTQINKTRGFINKILHNQNEAGFNIKTIHCDQKFEKVMDPITISKETETLCPKVNMHWKPNGTTGQLERGFEQHITIVICKNSESQAERWRNGINILASFISIQDCQSTSQSACDNVKKEYWLQQALPAHTPNICAGKIRRMCLQYTIIKDDLCNLFTTLE